MEKWLKKNLKYVTLVLLALFLLKNTQSCNRKMALRTQEKNLSIEHDSIVKEKNTYIYSLENTIDSLETENLTKDFLIKDLSNDLKIAGVRVDAADRRADAVQRTAEKVKSNTTIEIKGAEQDTTTNKK